MSDPTMPPPAVEDKALHRALADLVGIGSAWARYGLGVGSAALSTSATTLRTTARALEALSDRLEREEAPRAARAADEQDAETQSNDPAPEAA